MTGNAGTGAASFDAAVADYCDGLRDAAAARIDQATLLAATTSHALAYTCVLGVTSLLLGLLAWVCVQALAFYALASWLNIPAAIAAAIVVNAALALTVAAAARAELRHLRRRFAVTFGGEATTASSRDRDG